MTDFLLELRCEEIPARMQAGARADLEKLFRKELADAGVAVGDVTVWSTPRRLALVAHGLPDATQAVSEEVKGPRTSAPAQALEGFLRKTGLAQSDLTERDGVWFAVSEKPGRATGAVLAAAIPAIVRAFPWPKSMRWGAASLSTESLRWVRPLSGIVAIFGEDLVPCEVGGVASGFATRGHRFHCPGDITIGSAHDYADKLRACHVIVSHVERQDLIRTRASEAAEAAGLTLVADEGLVIENAGLTEWPVPLLGRFDADFLQVPPEVIQLTARVNQKYFVCEDASGTLANAFVCTANIEAADGGEAIVAGNRKVLAARLSDARFFWEQDRKTTLAQHAEKLARITFHEKLGTVADKVERIAKLARWLVEQGIVTSAPLPLAGEALPSETPLPLAGGVGGGPATSAPQRDPAGHAPTPQPPPASGRGSLADLAEQAARLCKADLVTEMVGEFPELQGLMGGYYARAEGLPDAVADAIRDHYKPVGQGDDVPTAPVTVAVSLADKLDTLAGFFAIDEKPTGSKDPFALRRAALGIIRTTLGCGLRVNLQDVTRRAAASAHFQLDDSPIDDVFDIVKDIRHLEIGADVRGIENHLLVSAIERRSEQIPPNFLARASKTSDEILAFFADRLKVQQREAGVRHDLIDAVFALGGEDDLVRLLARVHALQAFVATPDGANLLAGYKRAANILKKEDFAASGDAALQKALSYEPEPAEKALIDALDAAGPRAAAAIGGEDFAGAMAALASLRAAVDRFFEEVTVNDADPARREARLGLLARFRDAVHQVADFAKIEG